MKVNRLYVYFYICVLHVQENDVANGKISPLTVLTTDAGLSALELESFDNVTIFCLQKVVLLVS